MPHSKRKSHVTKVLDQVVKRSAQSPVAKNLTGRLNKTLNENGLLDQYKVIQQDLVRLRDDLYKGYDMAKGMMDRKQITALLQMND